jgi:hypothetical protein
LTDDSSPNSSQSKFLKQQEENRRKEIERFPTMRIQKYQRENEETVNCILLSE